MWYSVKCFAEVHQWHEHRIGLPQIFLQWTLGWSWSHGGMLEACGWTLSRCCQGWMLLMGLGSEVFYTFISYSDVWHSGVDFRRGLRCYSCLCPWTQRYIAYWRLLTYCYHLISECHCLWQVLYHKSSFWGILCTFRISLSYSLSTSSVSLIFYPFQRHWHSRSHTHTLYLELSLV